MPVTPTTEAPTARELEEDRDAAGPWTGAAVAAMEIGIETVT